MLFSVRVPLRRPLAPVFPVVLATMCVLGLPASPQEYGGEVEGCIDVDGVSIVTLDPAIAGNKATRARNVYVDHHPGYTYELLVMYRLFQTFYEDIGGKYHVSTRIAQRCQCQRMIQHFVNDIEITACVIENRKINQATAVT